LLGSAKDLARFRSINGVTGGDDTPLTESELREIFILSPTPKKKKNPNNPAPTYPSKSTTQNFTAAPSLLLLLLLLLLLHNQSSKTHIPKTKKNTKPDTELMLQTVIPKTNKQTTRAKAQQQEIHNKKIQTANAVVTD